MGARLEGVSILSYFDKHIASMACSLLQLAQTTLLPPRTKPQAGANSAAKDKGFLKWMKLEFSVSPWEPCSPSYH